MTKQKADLLLGTLDMLILKAVSLGALHGYGIIQRLRQMSGEMLEVEQGSLYPALYRIERKGWIEASWGLSDNQRRAKFYRLTPEGRRQLLSNADTWATFAQAVARVLSAKQQPAS